MPGISTHVLDTAVGQPAADLAVLLELLDGPTPQVLTETTTNEDGRVGELLGGHALKSGTYRLTFDTGGYGNSFYPLASVVFRVDDPDQHLHIPLLLSPFGYTTYRGS